MNLFEPGEYVVQKLGSVHSSKIGKVVSSKFKGEGGLRDGLKSKVVLLKTIL